MFWLLISWCERRRELISHVNVSRNCSPVLVGHEEDTPSKKLAAGVGEFFSEWKCQEAELATGEHQQRASREMSVFHPFDDANDYHMRA